jgi:peptidoglycan/xylan/chitin deacetylase (PgdA/CDA1 family)
MADTKWVHLINVSTHGPAIYFLASMFMTGITNYVDFFTLTASVIASCLMHLSETKHGLKGMFGLGQHSFIYLNIDRVIAVVLAVITAYRIYQTNQDLLFAVRLFVILAVITSIGELTASHYLYVGCHTIWHWGVFYLAGLYLAIANAHAAQNTDEVAHLVGCYLSPVEAYLYNPAYYIVTTGFVSIFVFTGAFLMTLHPGSIAQVEAFIQDALQRMGCGKNFVCRITLDQLDIDADKRQAKTLYLTIDDAPYSTSSTEEVLNELEKHGAKATFFITCQNLLRCNPLVIKRALDDGHTLANHMDEQEERTWDMTMARFEESVDLTTQTLQKLYKITPTWMRPASGWIQPEKIMLMTQKNLQVVLGSVCPFDAKPTWFLEKYWFLTTWYLKLWFMLYYESFGRPIVVLHDRPWAPQVLKVMLPWWKTKGWVIKALPDKLK